MLNDKEHKIETPELVALNYEVVGIGTRFIGVILDGMFIQLIVLAVVTVGLLVFSITDMLSDTLDAIDYAAPMLPSLAKALIAVLMLFYFVLTWGYHVWFETFKFGRTPGKKLAGCQVVKQDGSPITFKDSMIRNLLRIVDSLPFFYITGLVAHFVSANGQRLGDHAAGTIVVRNLGNSYLDKKQKNSSTANLPPPASAPPGSIYSMISITDEEYELITRFFKRCDSFDAHKRYEVAYAIAKNVAGKYSIPTAHYERTPEKFLRYMISIAG